MKIEHFTLQSGESCVVNLERVLYVIDDSAGGAFIHFETHHLHVKDPFNTVVGALEA